MSEGLGSGQGVGSIVRSVERDIGTDAVGGRLQTFTRTEVLRSYRGSSRDGFEAIGPDVIAEWEWMATKSSRTCLACIAMDGRRFPYDQYPNRFHVSCFPAGTEVNGPLARSATKRWYEGELVEIVTAGNQTLSVTPNHPILTTKGWVKAGLLCEGDDVIRYINPQGPSAAINPDYKHRPSLIEDVAESLVNSGARLARHVPTSPEDFHGDGAHGEVDVVFTDSLLRDAIDTSVIQPVLDQRFIRRNIGLPTLTGLGRLFSFFRRCYSTFSSIVSGGGQVGNLFGGGIGHTCVHGFGSVPGNDLGLVQMAANDVSSNPEVFSDSLFRFSSQITGIDLGGRKNMTVRPEIGPSGLDSCLDPRVTDMERLANLQNRLPGAVSASNIIGVNRRDFSGHVYNLETSEGWYTSNSIIAHNCRCVIRPVPHANLVPGALPQRELGSDWLARQEESVQRQVIGTEGRWKLYQDGAPLTDFVGIKRSRTWGDSLYVKPAGRMAS